jgi:SAM-dependent methyltransferase
LTGFDPKTYWEKRLTANYNLRGVGDRRFGQTYNAWLYRVRSRVFRRVTRRLDLDLQSASVVDIGSGTGFYVDQWLRLGVHALIGTDLTTVAVAKLKERFPAQEFCELDIGGHALPLAKGSFDAVSAFDVLFHIVDDDRYRKAISNIAALLRPGGYFLYSDNLLRAGSHRTDHQFSRSRSDFESTLHDAGLHIVLRRPMFYLMSTPVDSQSKLLKRSWERRELALQMGEKAERRIGRTLYPLELLLTAIFHEGPSTEVLVCRKRQETRRDRPEAS